MAATEADGAAAAVDVSSSIQQLFPKVFSIAIFAIRCDAVSAVLLCKSLVEKVLRPCAVTLTQMLSPNVYCRTLYTDNFRGHRLRSLEHSRNTSVLCLCVERNA